MARMTTRSRRPLALVALVAVAVVALAGYRWVNRPETIDGRGPTAGGMVLIIPGYGGGADGLSGLADFLRQSGREVVIAPLGDEHGDLRAYGGQVAQMASALVADGAASVDWVGYSAGGLIARAAVEASPLSIGRVVTIATPHGGTAIAGLGAMLADETTCPLACREMATDSEFLASLKQPGDATRWLSAFSSGDDVVRPPESSELDGATNIEVTSTCGTGPLDHGGIARSAATWAVVAGFLSSGQVPVCSST
jgi:pimeloyl-ACP methyl ester carboxylesterase